MGKLVLSRKTNESVQVGPDCTVTLLEIRGKKVRLMFEAPDTVSIYRTELLTQRSETTPCHDARGVETTPTSRTDHSGAPGATALPAPG